jgi:hypothetical protein
LRTASLLHQAVALDAAERVYRVTLDPDRTRRVQRMRQEIGDGPELGEALSFLDEGTALEISSLSDLLKAPFTRQPDRRYPSRFSNGDYGVLYTARDKETAAQEYAYWAPQYLNPTPVSPYRIRLHLISCWFEGRAKDVRPFLEECQWLISDDYGECQKLGSAARAEGLAGLIAPSARRQPDGVTVPILLADAASQPAEEGEVRFTVSAIEPTTFEISLRGVVGDRAG